MSEPPEELVKLKAHQIWEERQLDGREGTSQSDWEEAKRYLEGHSWDIFWWQLNRPYYLLEKRILEPIYVWMVEQTFFKVLIVAATFLSGVPFIEYFAEDGRRNNDILTAWQTITTAQGQSGSGGRIEALEYLNSRPLRFPWFGLTEKDWFWDNQEQGCRIKRLFGRRWRRVSLIGLSSPKTYLEAIILCGSDLRRVNLVGTYLHGAVLQGSNLQISNLQDTDLSGAKLQNANLTGTNLQGANLFQANLQNADLYRANLQKAILESVFENLKLSGYLTMRTPS